LARTSFIEIAIAQLKRLLKKRKRICQKKLMAAIVKAIAPYKKTMQFING